MGTEVLLPAIEPAQSAAAKVVGFLYLFTMATSIVGFSLRGPLLVLGDSAQTARKIAASERLYRISIVTDLLTIAGVIILVWALYVVLKPINRNVALLAAFFRLVENSIVAVITLSAFGVLALVIVPALLRCCISVFATVPVWRTGHHALASDQGSKTTSAFGRSSFRSCDGLTSGSWMIRMTNGLTM
jgi:Domain of unknown function (DUF4386)